MNLEIVLRKILGCSLLKIAKVAMGSYMIVFIVVFILMALSCSID